MSDLLFSTYNDLHAAYSIGKSLNKPHSHIVRLLTLFSPQERALLLQDAYSFYKTVDSNSYSYEQFVAHFLFSNPDSLIEFQTERLKKNNSRNITSFKLDREEKQHLASTCNGQNPVGAAIVISSTILGPLEYLDDSLIKLLTNALGNRINEPSLAAGIYQCLSFNRKLLKAYKNEAVELAGFAKSIPEDEFPLRGDVDDRDAMITQLNWDLITISDTDPSLSEAAYNATSFYGLAQDVLDITTNVAMNEVDELNIILEKNLSLVERFGFVQTECGLFVPGKAIKRLSADFDDLINRVRNRSELLALSPRQFEEFMRDLFMSLGYSVELTKATRDGGVDLVCLKAEHGIPFRLAVELKRYKDRPISVQMVRSFVGANLEFEANKMVYVTTSSYTSSATQFAQNHAGQLLALKDYDQIREWSEEAKRQPWQFLKNS